MAVVESLVIHALKELAPVWESLLYIFAAGLVSAAERQDFWELNDKVVFSVISNNTSLISRRI